MPLLRAVPVLYLQTVPKLNLFWICVNVLAEIIIPHQVFLFSQCFVHIKASRNFKLFFNIYLVVDQGFPKVEHQLQKGCENLLFCKMFVKNFMETRKWKNLARIRHYYLIENGSILRKRLKTLNVECKLSINNEKSETILTSTWRRSVRVSGAVHPGWPRHHVPGTASLKPNNSR